MTARLFRAWAATFLCAASTLTFAEVAITANITGIETERGVIRAALFSEKTQDKFPDGTPLMEQAVDAKKGGVSVTFKVPEPGYYAIAVMHDENNNGKMDTNFLGIPQEPNGNSGEVATLKPRFKNSRFLVDGKDVDLQIKLH